MLYDLYVLHVLCMCMISQGQSADLWRISQVSPNDRGGWLAHDIIDFFGIPLNIFHYFHDFTYFTYFNPFNVNISKYYSIYIYIIVYISYFIYTQYLHNLRKFTPKTIIYIYVHLKISSHFFFKSHSFNVFPGIFRHPFFVPPAVRHDI